MMNRTEMHEDDITIEAREVDGVSSYAIKIALPLIELNVTIPRAEIGRLQAASTADWTSGAVRLGTTAGVPVHWCAGEHGTILVLIGLDDQTWDVGLTLPASIIPQIFNGLPHATSGQ